ncbi:uncharacterized protein LOC141691241 [Apium graveolens]|uniref:uncharacterized protein LOC141691241 n=1 Tax=Apium graveolens TaxID=4045 RepID=UPI003D7B3DB6
MPFGLRNVGATFQRLVNKMFKDQIGQTMGVYIDDVVIKSVDAENNVRDLQEVFDILRLYNMKLNPSNFNCVVSSGKFLGHMVTGRGIETSPEQIKAIFELKSPSNVKDVQKLTGNVAALNRTTIKSQALDDFMADFSPSQMMTTEQEFQQVFSKIDTKPWTLYTDSASNVNGTGLGLVLKSPQGDMIAQSICCDFKAKNNEADYEALIMGLVVAKNMKIRSIDVNCDSLLIVNHVKGSYEAKDPKMVILGAVTKGLDLNNIPVVHIMMPAIELLAHDIEMMVLDRYDGNISEDVGNWINVYKDYLQLGVKPDNNNKARILRMKASRFTVIDDELFNKSSTGLLQRCLRKPEADMVLRDAHEGECGNHTNGRNLSLKIPCLGYYWPMLI